MFEGQPLKLSDSLIDIAWEHYFGKAHAFDEYQEAPKVQTQAAVM
jgi:hypothetical protein